MRERERDSLLINDVIASQWEYAVVLVSIQAPPPASVHGSPHGPAASHFHHAVTLLQRQAGTQRCCSWLCAHVHSEVACQHVQGKA